MLISIEDLKRIYTDKDFSKFSDERLKTKLEAIEIAIRAYTKCNFQNRAIRTNAKAQDGALYGDFDYFKSGDTVQISGSVNDGLYVLTSATSNSAGVDGELYDAEGMLITKIVYPLDVIDGCVELLDYDVNKRAQTTSGITSESISRHSVSYKQYSEANTIEGYPSEMFGFLRKYCQWRT